MSTPHLIPIKPIGEDFYEGKSHERLAEAIKDYIRSVDIKKQLRFIEYDGDKAIDAIEAKKKL